MGGAHLASSPTVRAVARRAQNSHTSLVPESYSKDTQYRMEALNQSHGGDHAQDAGESANDGGTVRANLHEMNKMIHMIELSHLPKKAT